MLCVRDGQVQDREWLCRLHTLPEKYMDLSDIAEISYLLFLQHLVY